jgi:hypothetical protein
MVTILCSGIGLVQQVVRIDCDSQSAIFLVKNPTYHSKTKHIDVLPVFVSIFGRFFGTWFFANGFLFPVKELGLLTNPGYWIRVLDATRSYMYIVL